MCIHKGQHSSQLYGCVGCVQGFAGRMGLEMQEMLGPDEFQQLVTKLTLSIAALNSRYSHSH